MVDGQLLDVILLGGVGPGEGKGTPHAAFAGGGEEGKTKAFDARQLLQPGTQGPRGFGFVFRGERHSDNRLLVEAQGLAPEIFQLA